MSTSGGLASGPNRHLVMTLWLQRAQPPPVVLYSPAGCCTPRKTLTTTFPIDSIVCNATSPPPTPFPYRHTPLLHLSTSPLSRPPCTTHPPTPPHSPGQCLPPPNPGLHITPPTPTTAAPIHHPSSSTSSTTSPIPSIAGPFPPTPHSGPATAQTQQQRFEAGHSSTKTGSEAERARLRDVSILISCGETASAVSEVALE